MSTARALNRILFRCEAIKTSAAKFNEDTSVEEVEINIHLLEDEWNEYRDLEKLIGESDKYEQLQNLVEITVFKLKEVLVRAKRERQAESSKYSHNASMDELMANQQSFLNEFSMLNKRENEVRLPRINVPSFSGEYSEFPSFKDLFEASIDSNPKISKVHKFQYLKGLLTGEASALVRHIAVTEANYIEAWDKIKERFDKRKLVISTLIKQFLDQPNITKLSAKALHQMADLSDEVLRGLKVLGGEAEKRDPWLMYILVSKLDGATRQAWATETAEEDFPSMERFLKFLNTRSDSLDAIDSNKLSPPTNNRTKSFQSASNEPVCVKCGKDHYLSNCDEFLSLSGFERRGFVSDNKLCFNCLSPSHQAVMCRSKYRCGKCRRRHHLTLHVEDDAKTEANAILSGNELNTSEAGVTGDVQNNNAMVPSFQSLLPTAIVQVPDRYGNLLRCRVLLDSGSQASFITEACMQRLKLPRTKANIFITGLTAGKITTRGAAAITVKSIYSPDDEICVDVLVISQLPTKLPSFDFKMQDCSLLNSLALADPKFNETAPIDILIGADKFFHVIKDGRVTSLNNSIIAQRTIFGWVVSGITDNSSVKRNDAVQANNCTLNLHIDVDIDSTLKRFFEQEEITSPKILSPEENECEEHYKQTYKRTKEGRYIVRIPFKKIAGQLGNSVNAAKRRFLALERKFHSNPSIQKEYANFMDEYINLKYLQPIEIDEIIDSKSFYLPHHCVFKESSETTKLRVVFDGSAKSTSGICINDTMLVGPTIQPTLWSILMRFRNYKIALTGDIEKMYNQIAVAEPDTHFQRILWRSEPANELKHYKLNTVTFGFASSSFLAIRTLQQIGYDNQQSNPNIVPYILEDFYVDDFISGADTVEEVQHLKTELTQVLLAGGFNIRKWKSNLPIITATEDTEPISRFQNSTETKILGLQWNAAEDVFSFKLTLGDGSKPTKRQIISEYSRVFDPLGWLSPTIILMKIVFQNLWLVKLGWDDELPDGISNIYSKIRRELKLLENISVKRYIPQNGQIEIHGFSDASEKAYSAVVYCRAVDENGIVTVNLMASKTKVAPIKQISLPRLELCGAFLVTKLLMLVKETIKRPVKCYAWTDSTVVLMWLSSHPARWKTYVANRTSEILNQLPRKYWNHVRSEHNPADCASRGVLPSKLVNLTQWWYGPDWLRETDIICAPQNVDVDNKEQVMEEREKVKIFGFNAQQQDDIINYLMQQTSAYTKMIRVFAYVLRFLKNARLPKSERRSGFLTVEELRTSRNIIIKYVQQETFKGEIECLHKGLEIPKNSDIISLAPFIDASGILRVGGRLRHANCPYNFKHPIVLPKGHIFSRVIILYMHKQNLHPGPSLTFHLTRQQFWIVGGRSIIRNIVKKCVVCFKNNARVSTQLMGDLPIARLKVARPFTACGVDYAGPIQLASKRGRGSRLIKGYIAIFICMATKAVHIEVVSEMSTDAFIAVLKRFVSRRGAPAHMYSDNGSNFLGAKRQLNEVFQIISNNNHNCIVAEHLSKSEIQWHFNPPNSPHFGGLWEAAVKSVKTHLIKCTSNTHLTFEEMTTLLSQIEAILNSRPLYATVDNDASFEVLTPAHFLIGSANFYLPEEEINAEKPAGRLTRWQLVQQRVQSFWRKFSSEYIHNLQQRAKWRKVRENLNIGDIVLVKEENLPSYKWALGKIIQLHPDYRGTVRVVTIKTSTSTLKRPIVKLCKLPEQEDG